jgi:threonine dehydratase
VVASSSGNHGIAVAYVAAKLGRRATIVLPEKPNPQKRAAIEALGARTILRGAASDERNAFARRLAEEREACLVPPFDDPRIIAGQGTVGLEVQEAGPPANAVLAPVGGGGLLSGVALSYPPDGSPVLFGVQPEGAASMRASLEAGEPVTAPARSFADGITVSRPGKLTFSVFRRRVREVLTVTDEEIFDATRTLWREASLPVEPASASTLAAALRYPERWRGASDRPTVVLVLSGGNVSDSVRARIESDA